MAWGRVLVHSSSGSAGNGLVARGRYARGEERFLVPSPREDVPPEPSSFLVTAMSEVTRVLSAIEQGDPSAAAQLLPLVYDELRKLAARKLAEEKQGQTLQATA